jgi:hypothetical protein
MNSFRSTVRIAALAWPLISCADPGPELPALEIESNRAVIGIHSELGSTLCQGDIALIDGQVEHVESHLGVHRDSPITVYLVPFSIIGEVCGPDVLACYQPGEDTIYSTWFAIKHELVHATARDIEFPSLFWSEGAAVLLSGSTLFDDRTVLRPDDLEAESLLTYRTAGHFSRFLVETSGWDAYRRVIRGEALEDLYGQSALELTSKYQLEAPYAYPPLDPCPYPRIPQVTETTWSARVDFSCESPDATEFEGVRYSGRDGAAVIRAVDLTAGTYDIVLSGGEDVFTIACHTEQLETEPTPPSNGDLYNEIDLALPKALTANEVHRLVLTDGTYLMSISSGTYDRASAELTITRIE